MQEQKKSIKQYCKEARKRLKTGFWEEYYQELDVKMTKAENQGISPSKVKEYLNSRLSNKLRDIVNVEDELFYEKVKKILLEEGEISNAIGRLTDKKQFEAMSYEEKQRYTLSLSERYVKAVKRFEEEKSLGLVQF